MWQEESSKRPSFAEIVEILQSNVRKGSVTSEQSYTDSRKNYYLDLLAK